MGMATTTRAIKPQAVIDLHDRCMSLNYPRYPVVMERGQGSRLYDSNGKEYLDLFAGFGAGLLGHCHPDLVNAVTDQAKKLWHAGNLLHTDPQTRLAEAISRHGFGGRSFFCHSGADANEAAFKLARLYGQTLPGPAGPRYKIISTTGSFHGRSFGTMVATGQTTVRKGFEPLLTGFEQVPYNDLDAMAEAIDDETVAVIVEPIQGEGGVNIPSAGYLPGLRTLCDEHDMLLICDEVWTGCGRTGKYFAYQHWAIEPDIMTLAKGVGGGLPVGVMCASPRVAELYDCRKQGVVKHATTLGGNCLSMAAAAKLFDVLERDDLVAHALEMGARAVERLRESARQTPAIKRVRGVGLFIGIELAPGTEGSTLEPAWFENAKEVVDRCMERGVLINSTQGDVLRLAPPLTISQDDLDQGIDVIEQVITGQ